MNQRSMVVSIIGRPNVGKSTIFNRLMRKQHLAMTHDMPGVTRDRHYGICTLEEHHEGHDLKEEMILVDTGGFYPEKIETDPRKKNNVDPFFNIMADHAKLAIDESDLVLFVVDVREGLLPFDKGICDYIRSTKKPFWVLMNKFDTEKQEGDQYDFYELGLDEDQMFRLSAEHNRGLYDLRTNLLVTAKKYRENGGLTGEIDALLQKGVKPVNEVVASVAIVGAPNAGKSTLLNRLVGAQRALVSEIAGTTVDPIEGYIDMYFGPDIDILTAQENQFVKKDTVALYEEMKSFHENTDETFLMDEEDLTEEEKRIYVEYGQTQEMVVDEDFGEEFSEESEFNYDESNLGDDLYSESNILSAIEKNWRETDDDEVADIKHVSEVNRWRSIKLVDTAGIRKSKVVEGFIETQSVYRSLKAISESDVVIFMIDSTLGITHQDRRLIDIALEKGKSLIVCLNKIDLLQEIFADKKKKDEWMKDLRYQVPWLSFCQLVTISAFKNRNINYLREAVKRTIVIRNRKVPTGALNRCLFQLVDKNPVVLKKSNGNRFKVKYASMLKSSPPTFLLFSNKSLGIPENYRKYLINGLRKEFDLTNTPVHLIFRTSTDIERRMKKIEKKNQLTK